MRWTLPNILTLARICLTPVIALLPFIQGYWPKVIAFVIFLAAGASRMGAGKLKAVVQNVFIGATLFWFAWKDALAAHRWAGWFRNFWNEFHGAVVAVTLAGAILLTVYSLIVYLYRYRALLKGGG